MELPSLKVAAQWIVSEKSDDSNVTKFEGQSRVEEAIWSTIHDKRFYLPEQAPVCKGILEGEFEYQDNTTANWQILSGEYSFVGGVQ